MEWNDGGEKPLESSGWMQHSIRKENQALMKGANIV